MRIELYYSSTHTLLEDPANEGFHLDEILQLLRGLESQGRVACKIVDSRTLADRDLHDVYVLATMPAVNKARTGYNIRQVFGSRRRSSTHFGTQVPALLVYDEVESTYPTDVYPHRVGQAMMTIREFLEGLS